MGNKFKVGDKVVYMVYGLENAELHTVMDVDATEPDNVWISVDNSSGLEHENDFVAYEGSEYQWKHEGKEMYAAALKQAADLQSELSALRTAKDYITERFQEVKANNADLQVEIGRLRRALESIREAAKVSAGNKAFSGYIYGVADDALHPPCQHEWVVTKDNGNTQVKFCKICGTEIAAFKDA